MKREEDRLQIGCKYWFDMQYPNLRLLLHHSPNEGLLPATSRDGAKRKAMGVRAGFPDFILLVATTECPYLAIELKAAKGRQTDTQKLYQEAVEQWGGGKYVIVRTFDEFQETINNYLQAKQKQQTKL